MPQSVVLPALEQDVKDIVEREAKASVSFEANATIWAQEEDEWAEQDDYNDHYMKEERKSQPRGVHQTFIRMDEISKQVHRMSETSLTHLKDFRKSLHDRGITDPHEQEEIMMKQKGHRRDSFGTKTDDPNEGGNSWEAAEEHFLDDVSRSTMEEQFVKSVQPEPDLDLHLLEMLGSDGESKLFLDYQRIVEYFRHKNAIMDRKIGMKSMAMAAQSGDESLKELSQWHGEAQGRRGPRKAILPPGGLDDLEDEDAKSSATVELDVKGTGYSNKEQDGSKDVQASSGPPGTQGRRATITSMKKGGSGRFKQLSVNTKLLDQQELDAKQGPYDEGGSYKSGTSTPTSIVQGGEEPVTPGNPRPKNYMARKGMGRLYRRPPGKSPNSASYMSSSGKPMEVSNDASPNRTVSEGSGEEEDLSSPHMKHLSSAAKFEMQMKRKAAKARASIEDRNHTTSPASARSGRPDAKGGSMNQQMLPEIKQGAQGNPRGNRSSNEPGLEAPTAPASSSSSPSKPSSSPARSGGRPFLNKQRTKGQDQL